MLSAKDAAIEAKDAALEAKEVEIASLKEARDMAWYTGWIRKYIYAAGLLK